MCKLKNRAAVLTCGIDFVALELESEKHLGKGSIILIYSAADAGL